MTRLYTGIDMIEIARIKAALERYGERFLQRVFTLSERERYAGRPESLAARWAAKEAAAKMLGVGLRGPGSRQFAVAFTDIEVLADADGRPVLQLYERAEQRANALAISELSVSLSHTRTFAVASVTGVALTQNRSS